MGNGTGSEGVEERSIDVGPDLQEKEHLNRALQEHYVLKQAVNIRQGPKYPASCSLIERAQSFESCN
jgi:hypothetical protein